MSNETFLISLRQNNDLTKNSINNLHVFLDQHPLQQRKYVEFAKLAGNSKKYGINSIPKGTNQLSMKKVIFLGSIASTGYGSLGEDLTEYLYIKDFLFSILDIEFGHGLSDSSLDSMPTRWNNLLAESAPNVLAIELPVSDRNADIQVVLGNLKKMVEKTKKVWNCPILVYTANYFQDNAYLNLVEQISDFCEKSKITFLNFYQNQKIKQNSKLYTVELGYPTRAALKEIWVPNFERAIETLIKKNS